MTLLYVLLGLVMPKRAFCWFGAHDPVRQPLGGMRCRSCNKAGDGYADFGFDGGSYVPPTRRTFERKHESVIRTSAWPDEKVTQFRKRRGA